MRDQDDDTHPICPRCAYRLTPLHRVEGRQRRTIGFTCPEPYCDFVLPLDGGGGAADPVRPLAGALGPRRAG